ncbi:hypothetical protein CMV_030810, partial [Castanea mollissima]
QSQDLQLVKLLKVLKVMQFMLLLSKGEGFPLKSSCQRYFKKGSCNSGFREAVDILKYTHELLSKDLSIDSFSLIMHEMQANLSLLSFSSQLASQ